MLKKIVLLNFFLLIFFTLFPHRTAQARRLLYLEEFYRLYYLPSLYTEENTLRNIFWLDVAIKMPFAPPIQALVVCDTEQQYEKYRHLMKMHLYYLMTKNALYTAARFDKHTIRFSDAPYKKEILESLKYADFFYKQALVYWKQAFSYQEKVQKLKWHTVELDFLNDLAYRINKGDLDYQRIIQRHLNQLNEKIAHYQSL